MRYYFTSNRLQNKWLMIITASNEGVWAKISGHFRAPLKNFAEILSLHFMEAADKMSGNEKLSRYQIQIASKCSSNSE